MSNNNRERERDSFVNNDSEVSQRVRRRPPMRDIDSSVRFYDAVHNVSVQEVCVFVCMCVYMCVCVYVCVFVCMCITLNC